MFDQNSFIADCFLLAAVQGEIATDHLVEAPKGNRPQGTIPDCTTRRDVLDLEAHRDTEDLPVHGEGMCPIVLTLTTETFSDNVVHECKKFTPSQKFFSRNGLELEDLLPESLMNSMLQLQ